MIQLKFDDSEIQAVLRQLKAKMGDLSEPMNDAGQYIVQSVRERFVTSTGPDGQAWEKRKDSTIAALINRDAKNRKKDGSLSAKGKKFMSGKKLLTDSRALVDSIAHEYTSTSTTIKPGGLPYAAAHQFGGKPYVIEPKNKKALAFNGIVRKRVTHPGQTARPYLGFSDDDRSEILGILRGFLEP